MGKEEYEFPNIEQMADNFFTDLSLQLAEMAKGFFKGSFFKEGFTDYGFTAWPKRIDTMPHNILTKSHALRDSVTITEANFKSTNENINDFTRSSWSRFNHYKSLDYIIIYRGDNAIKLKRSIIESGYDFYADKINSLF